MRWQETSTKRKKSARKSNKKSGWQIRINKPKMSIFSQKRAQYAFSSTLKQQKRQKTKNSNPQNRNLQKTSPKIKQISINTSPKTSNPQLQKKAGPNSREIRKVGKTGRKCANCQGGLVLVVGLHWSSSGHAFMTVDPNKPSMTEMN